VDDRPADAVAERLDRGGLLVAVLVMAGVQLYTLAPVILGWRYGGAGFAGAIWLVFGVAGGVSAWVALRGGGEAGCLLGWSVPFFWRAPRWAR
jgi:hypothetical protein